MKFYLTLALFQPVESFLDCNYKPVEFTIFLLIFLVYKIE